MSLFCKVISQVEHINKTSYKQSSNNSMFGKKPSKSVPLNLAIGKFDTLHRGHQKILSKLADMEGESGIISFDPSPSYFFNQTSKHHQILPIKLKQIVLSEMKVSKLFLIAFDEDLAKMSPSSFMQRYLLSLEPRSIIVGADFRFGHNRTGSISDLASFCLSNDIKFYTEQLYNKQKGGSGNSANLRSLIEQGLVSKFNQQVGRPFMILGRVERGETLGRKLGFKTANIKHNDFQVMPKFGSYVIRARFVDESSTQKEKRYFDGVANFGCRPSINNKNQSQVLLEAHLFSELEDFYGEKMLVELISFIREEKKFETIDQLKQQISLDINYAKKNIYLN